MNSPPPREKIRVLLACVGWPSGILDVGSWAAQNGLAEVCVFQMQPGRACVLAEEDRADLILGPANDELRDAFRRRGLRLSAEALVRRLDERRWEIDDRGTRQVFQVLDADGRLDVLRPAECEMPQGPIGLPAVTVREALWAVGRSMIEKLLRFAPHVVGFRLEGGGFHDVCKYIAAVRLFCDAEIVLGGPTATTHARETLDDCGADYVFAGEAEESFAQFLRLARRPNSRERAAEIPGLAYRYGARTYHNTLPADGYQRTRVDADAALHGPERARLGHCWRPAVDPATLAANRLNWALLENFQREFDSLFFVGGRGCPGECAFCARLHGQEVRVKTASHLLEEITAADACVRRGALKVSRWPLFRHVERSPLREQQAAWAAIYDEDFFLHRRRAIEFFQLWEQSPLREQYRLSVQTNPCSLLDASGRFHPELWTWIDRLKPMIQLGAESFHDALLARWRKRHHRSQLQTVLAGLDQTRQDYTVFQILIDFESTPTELLETLRRLALAAFAHPRMRIASSPYTIPLFDSDLRRSLEHSGRIGPADVRHFTDYERAQPGWLDPLAAELAERADAELHFALELEHRDAALLQALEAVRQRVGEKRQGDCRAEALWRQACDTLDEVRQAQFRGL